MREVRITSGSRRRLRGARPAPTATRVAVEVQYATSRRGVPHARTLRAWAAQVTPGARRSSRIAGPASRSVVLRVVGAAESRRLNHRWRGKDRATNVLSFPAGEPVTGPEEPAPLGDIVLCAPVIRREAREQGKPPGAHWAHMVVHGMLHLLGYDHVSAPDAAEMEGLEMRLLADLGVADPYDA